MVPTTTTTIDYRMNDASYPKLIITVHFFLIFNISKQQNDEIWSRKWPNQWQCSREKKNRTRFHINKQTNNVHVQMFITVVVVIH